jgi:hypothetical protein
MITKKITKKELQNSLKALSDNFIYLVILDDGKIILKDSKISVTMESK